MLLFLYIVQLLEIQKCIKPILHNFTIEKSFSFIHIGTCLHRSASASASCLALVCEASCSSSCNCCSRHVSVSVSAWFSKSWGEKSVSNQHATQHGVHVPFAQASSDLPLISPVSLLEASAAGPGAFGSPPAAFPSRAADPPAPWSLPRCHPMNPDQIPPLDC